MTRPDFIETFSGVRFRPLDPNHADVRIADIAHALSQQNRFTGHTREPYSVAEHSVRVSMLLADWDLPTWVQLWGLLHDASEAYLQDVASPLKCTEAFAPYREAEARLQSVICEAFGLQHEEPGIVKEADAVMLATEARDLMPFRKEHWAGLTHKPLKNHKITPWPAAGAKHRFLFKFKELSQ